MQLLRQVIDSVIFTCVQQFISYYCSLIITNRMKLNPEQVRLHSLNYMFVQLTHKYEFKQELYGNQVPKTMMRDLGYHEIIFSYGPTLAIYQSLSQNSFVDLICIGHLIRVRHCSNAKELLFIFNGCFYLLLYFLLPSLVQAGSGSSYCPIIIRSFPLQNHSYTCLQKTFCLFFVITTSFLCDSLHFYFSNI